MLKEKPTMLLKEKTKDKTSAWSPSMGDYVQSNSQNDSENLRKDQLKYKATIILLVGIMAIILLGSIIYFNT